MIKISGFKDATALLVIIWCVSLLDFLLPSLGLSILGIAPRSISGLLGIPFSVLIHGSLFHLLSNTVPLFVLMLLLSYSEARSKCWRIVTFSIIGSGVITWFLSTGGIVVGASGLIFALIGYLLADCFFNPCRKSVPVGLITLFVFGGSIFSLYHFAPHISFAAHFGGLITGLILAKLVGGRQ